MPATEFTTINKSWSWKMFIFLIVLFAFGCWGLYDAAYLYPQRGIKYAANRELLYLSFKKAGNALKDASIAEPQGTFEALKARKGDLDKVRARLDSLAENDPQRIALAPQLADSFALEWLEGLSMVGRLAPKYTTYADAQARLSELEAQYKKDESTPPLSQYDIPLQWLFCGLGFAGALWVLWLIAKVFKTRYGWDPATQTLYLPGGRELTPDQITEFDKRKWSKFFITLNTSSGPSVTLDLLRYAPLEEWVLAMERTRFPESVQADAPAEQSGEATPAESDKPASE